jgi:O-antigen ligase
MDYWDLQRFNVETTAKGLNPAESNLARFLIWSSAMPVIKEHLLFGVGTGDVSDALALSAESKGIYAFKKYNTHDQFIETQMGLGLPGLFLLLFLTFGALIYALAKKDLLLAVLALLFILNFFVESMLIGNYIPLFFSLFLYLFIKVNTEEEHSKTAGVLK